MTAKNAAKPVDGPGYGVVSSSSRLCVVETSAMVRAMNAPRRFALLVLMAVMTGGTGGGPVTSAGAADKTEAAPPREAAQFDFIVGEWQVTTPDGKVAGENVLEKILNGRVVLESWTGSGGYIGKSFNIFDAALGKWRQFWVDASGLTLDLSGGMVGGSMVLEGDRLHEGKTVRDRIRWTPNSDGTVRQLWEASEDGGKSWRVVFDGLYRRKR